MIAESMTCYDPFCLGVNTHIAIARQHMAMLETESNIGLSLQHHPDAGNSGLLQSLLVLSGLVQGKRAEKTLKLPGGVVAFQAAGTHKVHALAVQNHHDLVDRLGAF